jgi:hypothetical protein
MRVVYHSQSVGIGAGNLDAGAASIEKTAQDGVLPGLARVLSSKGPALGRCQTKPEALSLSAISPVLLYEPTFSTLRSS